VRPLQLTIFQLFIIAEPYAIFIKNVAIAAKLWIVLVGIQQINKRTLLNYVNMMAMQDVQIIQNDTRMTCY